MRENTGRPETIDSRIAARLKELRAARGWSLDELAKRSEVSRATLSRLEKAEVSASAAVLGKLCAVYGLPMSRLMTSAMASARLPISSAYASSIAVRSLWGVRDQP